MLIITSDPNHHIMSYVKDDPVRPDIPNGFRVASGRIIAALVDNETPRSIVCISFHSTVPDSVESLNDITESVDTCVFYTIWAYQAGAGRDLLFQVVKQIQQTRPEITRFVTLSPQTEMARRFHIKNGARVFRTNSDTVNYEYLFNQI